MTIGGIDIEVIRKEIKNIHLAVYPPEGHVRLAVPSNVSDETVHMYLISRLTWIKKQQRRFKTQNRQTPRQYVDRESHYFLGRRYLLRVHEGQSKRVVIKNKQYMDLYLPLDCDSTVRGQILDEWYRRELKRLLQDLIPKWELLLGVKARSARVQRMRTKWGSCNPDTGNTLFNLELAKKPVECIEYVVAHELAHLIERTHNERFQALLSTHLPGWQGLRQELNEMIL